MAKCFALMLFILIWTNNAAATSGCRAEDGIQEHVGLIELNHFHDSNGKHVYDQVIFYEFNIELQAYVVRAWILVEDRHIQSRMPTQNYNNNTWRCIWFDRDQSVNRVITSTHFRESWTQVDPERANKKIFPEKLRTGLAMSPSTFREYLAKKIKKQNELNAASDDYVNGPSDTSSEEPELVVAEPE